MDAEQIKQEHRGNVLLKIGGINHSAVFVSRLANIQTNPSLSR